VDELGSSLGIVALSLLGLQLVLPARLPLVSGGLGADLAVRLHRRLADVTFAVIAAHVAVVVLAEPARAAFLAFVGTPWPVQAAVVSTGALGALASSSTWRGRLRLPYSTWRALHLGLAAGALVFATAHTIGVDRYLTRGIAAVWLALLVLGSLAALVELRVLRPRRLARDAYVVQEVVTEPGTHRRRSHRPAAVPAAVRQPLGGGDRARRRARGAHGAAGPDGRARPCPTRPPRGAGSAAGSATRSSTATCRTIYAASSSSSAGRRRSSLPRSKPSSAPAWRPSTSTRRASSMSELPALRAARSVDRIPRSALTARLLMRIPPGAATAIMCGLTVLAALGYGATGH